jgi:protein required for attachment to host cells
MKTIRAWVLIADGAHAKILKRSSSGLKPLSGLTFDIDLPASHEILTDRPGRTFESEGPTRHAKANPTDPHRELKRAFAKMIAGVLKAKLADKQYDQLVMVAPPTTLGDLRSALPKNVRERIITELAHDLVKTPHSQLWHQLSRELPGELGLSAPARKRR